MCRYLSLRGSSFLDFEVISLLVLKYMDIRESTINNLNLLKCLKLSYVVCDNHQVVLVNNDVKIVRFTFPLKAPNDTLDTYDMYK